MCISSISNVLTMETWFCSRSSAFLKTTVSYATVVGPSACERREKTQLQIDKDYLDGMSVIQWCTGPLTQRTITLLTFTPTDNNVLLLRIVRSAGETSTQLIIKTRPKLIIFFPRFSPPTYLSLRDSFNLRQGV